MAIFLIFSLHVKKFKFVDIEVHEKAFILKVLVKKGKTVYYMGELRWLFFSTHIEGQVL